jgi:hypothetical protein
MNDFLTYIAAKALNLMPVVRPRLASLFEPPPGVDGLSTAHELGSDSAPGDRLSDETASPASLTDLHQREQAGISHVSPPRPQVFAPAAPPNNAVETAADRRQPP